MKIAVLAHATDACAAALAAELGCARLELSLPAGTAVEMSAAGVVWAGVPLHELDTLVVSGFDHEDPLVPRALPGADFSVWQIDYIVDQQRASFVASVLRELGRRGVRVVNSWESLQLALSKPRVLGELARAGCRVPAWLCTSDPEAAKTFCGSQERVLWRPASGRAKWQLFLDKQREALVGAGKPPVLLAAHPRENLRRAFVCAGEVLLAIECTVPVLDPLERMEEVWACDSAPVDGALVAAAQAALASWAQISYTLQDGTACIYDVDPDPRYAWLPGEFRAYLVARLARRLLGQRAPALPVPPRRERDSLFLRRMLVSLHDMEATKYRK
jgi:hypothetical protein